MTRGMFTASIAVVAALSIPASSGLVNPLTPRVRTSSQGVELRAKASSAPPAATHAPDASPAAVVNDTVVVSGNNTSDTASRPTLSMVPRNPKLQSRLRAMLPPDLTVRQAAQGFVDQRQFVSTVHVSRNLRIPFPQLKAKIVDEGLSLGQAIQVLRPGANVWRELTLARDETTRDIR